MANPLSAKFDTLRPSLLPGLVDAVAHNRRHGRRDVGLFEVGTRFSARAARRAAWRSRGPVGGRRALVGTPARGRFLRRQRAWSNSCAASLGVAPRCEPAARRSWCRDRRRRSPPAARRSAIVGQVTPASPTAAECRARTRCLSPRSTWTPSSGARVPTARGGPVAAAPSVCRPRSVDCRGRRLACRDHSWHHSSGRRGGARAAGRRRIFDRYQGKGVPEGSSQPVGADDIPGRRSDADRRRRAASVDDDSGRARARARAVQR